MLKEFTIECNFAPVPYRSSQIDEFRKKLREQLDGHPIIVGDCYIQIELHLKQDRSTETDQYADLDNYAKSILDALKGNEGIILDDCLICNFSLTKLEFVRGENFTIRIQCFPEHAMHKPIVLYEMPNGRYYPLPKSVRMQDGSVKEMPEFTATALEAICEMTGSEKEWKHKFHQSGVAKEDAFQLTHPIHPNLPGLPKSRVVDSGFEIIELKKWKS